MGPGARLIVLLLVLAGLVGVAAFFRCEGADPVVRAPEVAGLGRDTATLPLELADEGSGLRSVEVRLRHAAGENVLLVERFPGDLLRGGGPETRSVEAPVDARALGLPEGDAFLDVSVRDWSWRGLLRGNRTVLELPVAVDLRAPSVGVENGLTYVRRAGSSAVVYSVGEPTRRDGVLVGESFFPGFPWPPPEAGAEDDAGSGTGAAAPEAAEAGTEAAAPELRPAGRRVAIFAIPRDAPGDPRIRVLAEDRVGNRTERGWATRPMDREFPNETIRLPGRFLENKIPPLAQAHDVRADDPVAAFRAVNEELRAANEARIRSIVSETAPRPLWDGAFEQMENSQVTSRFAEKRRYLVDGEQVSEAIHFGYDLASTAGAPIEASNAGHVLFADELGIYGQCVILDHGLGVASLYGHLSRIDVAEGEEVAKGRVIGRSGETGLAGGDHLHFAILVSGTYVDPVEWWDPKWLHDHVEERLGPIAAEAAAEPAP